MVWVSDKLLPWLIVASAIALCFSILVLLPLCIFRKARPWAGIGFYIVSFVFGAMLFVFSCIVVFAIWGYVGLVVGLIFGGVGVVPVAFFASIAKAQWQAFWSLVFGIVLTFGARSFGIYISGMAKPDDDKAYDAP